MTEMNLVQAIHSALRCALRDDENVLLMGEDIGTLGGVFRVTEGLRAEFGPDRVLDTPLSETGILRNRHWHGALRASAGLRDPVCRLHLPGLRSARQRSGEVSLSNRGRVSRADGRPHAVWRRDSRRSVSFPVARSPVHPHARIEGRLPIATRTMRRGFCSKRSGTKIRSSSSSRNASTER